MELWKWLQKNHETWFWWEIHPHVGLLLLLLRCWVQELYSWSPPGVSLFMKFFHSFLFMWRMLKWPFIIYGKHVNVLDVFNLGLQLFLTMLQIVFSRPGNEAVLSCPSESFPSANWSIFTTLSEVSRSVSISVDPPFQEDAADDSSNVQVNGPNILKPLVEGTATNEAGLPCSCGGKKCSHCESKSAPEAKSAWLYRKDLILAGSWWGVCINRRNYQIFAPRWSDAVAARCSGICRSMHKLIVLRGFIGVPGIQW